MRRVAAAVAAVLVLLGAGVASAEPLPAARVRYSYTFTSNGRPIWEHDSATYSFPPHFTARIQGSCQAGATAEIHFWRGATAWWQYVHGGSIFVWKLSNAAQRIHMNDFTTSSVGRRCTVRVWVTT